MRLWRSLLFALATMLLTVSVLAQDNVTFTNSDGTFTGTSLTAGDLSLGTSTLVGVSGFTGSLAGFNGFGSNLGTLDFTTAALTSGSMIPLTGQSSTFGNGGMFNVVDNAGFTFSAMFSGAHWFCVGTCQQVLNTTNEWQGTWQFNGMLTDVMLTINGQQIPINGAVVFQGSVDNGIFKKHANGTVTVTDTGGTTNFNLAPEPGSLTLFGSGLIAVGLLTKYGRTKKLPSQGL